MKRTTYTLTDASYEGAQRLGQRSSEENASAVADAAIRHFLTLPAGLQQDEIDDTILERGEMRRPAWVTAFWARLSRTMGVAEWQTNPYAPRQYGDFVIVELQKTIGQAPDENEGFMFHAFKQGTDLRNGWSFKRDASPVRVANEVATWLLANWKSGTEAAAEIDRRARTYVDAIELAYKLDRRSQRALLEDKLRDFSECRRVFPNDPLTIIGAVVSRSYEIVNETVSA
jgi:hypothetical protein